jgi:hypothetical protein
VVIIETKLKTNHKNESFTSVEWSGEVPPQNGMRLVINLNIFVALQMFDAGLATALFDLKGNFLQFAHFLGNGQNIKQAFQHGHDSLAAAFLGLQQRTQRSDGAILAQQIDLLDIAT